MRSRQDIEQVIDTHGNTVWRVCVLYFKQTPDAQDAFQETILKYSLNETAFKDNEHQKAWLIRVATNICKDMLKASHRKNLAFEDSMVETMLSYHNTEGVPDSGLRDILEAFCELTDPPRTPLFLALYEGYSSPEISQILDMPVNTVYSWISRGKQQLREVLS